MTGELRQALQLAKDGAWDAAHQIVQDRSDANACLIHACLHRIEGDLSNAEYWYRRAGQEVPDESPQQELARLAERLGAPQ